jgi:type I restriction enzyme R subunit
MKHREFNFEEEIVKDLLNNRGWVEGISAEYDKELGLYTKDLIEFIKTTEPKAYEKIKKREKEKTDEVIAKFVAKNLNKYGTLWCLKNPLKYIGAKFKLAQFKPELENIEVQKKYENNILRVVRQVHFSTKNSNKSIDLVFFLNGIPIITMELKTDFTQSVYDAINQYKFDRDPRESVLLKFKRGALVHFAVSEDEVYMTTKLDKTNTRFLPFNKGYNNGAGNPPNPNGYATSYLWEEILERNSILNIIEKYIYIDKKEEMQNNKKIIKESIIFPRFHQLDAVRKLLSDSKQGSGKRYLIQHSAGSGKSNSIAWLAHQLATLHNDEKKEVFDSVIVVTDRNVLDAQLQDTISSIEHKDGFIVKISRKEGSKSSQLASSLKRGAKIIITTIQTFPYVAEEVRGLKGKKFAIIADEAHSSQTGSTAKLLRLVLTSEELDEVSAEDLINAFILSEKEQKNLSFYAFTATPKAKTLEVFGSLPDSTKPPSKENKPQPFHLYSMKQAIEEGFILDVLKGYITYKDYYKLALSSPDKDREVEIKKAKSKITKWLKEHPSTIEEKIKIIIEHFKNNVLHLLEYKSKAMIVTSSRKAAVRYKILIDRYLKTKGYNFKTLVAFSGSVEDDIEGEVKEYTENSLNKISGDIRKVFRKDEYKIMIVANKFQTGFDEPRLCAMYVDKKLGGVECVQTLSRLNRIYPGKEQTFILDFVNDVETIKKSFEPYYEATEIEEVTDPNIVYDIELKLKNSDIFTKQEVKNYAKIYFDPKKNHKDLSAAIKPPADRFKIRYKDALEKINNLKEQIKTATDEETIEHLKLELSKAEEEKQSLEIFKKDLGTFIRMYEFLSQIVEYEDEELLELWVFAKGLLPNLKTLTINEPVDLSGIILTHYKLQKQQETSISLEENKSLKPIKPGGAKPREPKTDLISKIIKTLNEIFGKEISDEDILNYANAIKDKVMSNEAVMDKVKNNSKDQALMGGFEDAVKTAVVENFDTHQKIAEKLFSETNTIKLFANIIYEMVNESLINHTISS